MGSVSAFPKAMEKSMVKGEEKRWPGKRRQDCLKLKD